MACAHPNVINIMVSALKTLRDMKWLKSAENYGFAWLELNKSKFGWFAIPGPQNRPKDVFRRVPERRKCMPERSARRTAWRLPGTFCIVPELRKRVLGGSQPPWPRQRWPWPH